VVSRLIYWRLVVPRLPHIHHVPVTSWVGVYAPSGVGALAAGARLSSARHIPSHACVAAFVPAAAPVIWSVITRPSVGHDLVLRDLIRCDYIALLLCYFAAMTIAFGVAITVGHAAVAERLHAG
jgi:hypothetical protein